MSLLVHAGHFFPVLLLALRTRSLLGRYWLGVCGRRVARAATKMVASPSEWRCKPTHALRRSTRRVLIVAPQRQVCRTGATRVCRYLSRLTAQVESHDAIVRRYPLAPVPTRARYDWSNAKNIWANHHPLNSEELITAQAEAVYAADPGVPGYAPRVWAYRNTIKALK